MEDEFNLAVPEDPLLEALCQRIVDRKAQLEILTSGDIGIGTSDPSNIGVFDRVMEINGYNSSKIVVSNDYTSINTSLMANRWGNLGGFEDKL